MTTELSKIDQELVKNNVTEQGRNWYMLLEGMPMQYSYNESGFDPVVSDTVLEKELSTITEKVKV
jgi:hypothetical protein